LAERNFFLSVQYFAGGWFLIKILIILIN